MRKAQGFSLIELLIVVAIILIIAAIAIPNLIRARISANQSSAVASLRSIATAQIQYSSSYPQLGYALTEVQLGTGTASNPPTPCPVAGAQVANACLIDGVLTAARAILPKSGYFIGVDGIVGPGGVVRDTFQASAGAHTWDRTGANAYCAIEDGVVRYDQNLTKSTGAFPNVAAAACLAAPFIPLNN